MATEISVRLDHDLQFVASTPSGSELRLDAGVASGGGDADPTPMDALLIALASCGAMDVISILRKMREEVAAYEVRASGERAATHPRVFTAITLRHIVRGDVVEANLARAIQLSMSRYCPVFATIAPTTPIEVRYELQGLDGQFATGAVESE